jgi:hypothetical protein
MVSWVQNEMWVLKGLDSSGSIVPHCYNYNGHPRNEMNPECVKSPEENYRQ